MSLRNRVTPFGEIVATPERGTLTGNRGIIHDPETRTLLNRRWSSKAWIACVCDFRGRRRKVMSTRSWTELFFLDEATAFAAGHRPCFYCRRADAVAFRDAWVKAHRTITVLAKDMDTVLHTERLEHRAKRLHPLRGNALALPDGAMVARDEACFLISFGRAWRWSFSGYRLTRENLDGAKLLTPPSTIRAFAAGYSPALHVSLSR